jgi:hypothetical protein
LSGLISAAQEIDSLEKDLSETRITDLKQVKLKTDKIFEIDSLNEVATYFLVEAYRYADNDSLIPKFFDEQISRNPKNPVPYLLSAKYQFRDFSISDTSRLLPLKQAVELDQARFETNYLLGISYYELFNQKYALDSLSHPTSYAFRSRKYLTEAAKIDSSALAYLKYPIIQLSYYLGDTRAAMLYENQEFKADTNINRIPNEGHFYFPIDRFIELEENWKTTYSVNVVWRMNMATFVLEWYSKHLRALKESAIFNRDNDTIYRFTWLRTFHQPVVIRVQKQNDEFELTWKMSDGAGGYSPGKIIVDKTKKLSKSEWAKIQELISESKFWEMATIEQSDVIGYDGSRWIIEGFRDEKYTVVDRWTPQDTDYQKLGLYLISLTDLKIRKEDIY